MKQILIVLLLVSTAGIFNTATADIRSLLQMVDYMGVDYPVAVQNGEIINQAEYTEMQEFARNITGEIESLESTVATKQLNQLANELTLAVENRAAPSRIADITREMRELLMENYDIVLTPRTQPNLQAAADLYASDCASCHGAEGMGNGPAAAGMEPPPTDFHEVERATERTLYGLYNTITLGVEGTTMVGRPDLTDAERWALAFYVGQMYADDALVAKGAKGKEAFKAKPLSLKDAVTRTPRQIAEDRPAGDAVSAWIRQHPEALFAGKPSPLDTAEQDLEESLKFYIEGDMAAAKQHAIRAYLEGFELVEAPLQNLDSKLMRETENSLMAYRHALQQGVPINEAQARYNEATDLLAQSRELLSGGSLSPTVAFTGSFVILLREGLEAILVLAAVMAFLTRSGRRDALKYVHGGWIAALIAGGATWAVATYAISISGAAREVTEGVAALSAAVILLYVGFWMHRNADSKRWAQYLEEKTKTALTTGTLWTLCLVSFLAVYREIFETILFYQALWVQVGEESHYPVFYGAGVAAVLLIAITWAFARYSVRLPLRQFFLGSAILVVVLAFIFTGKGIVALQEAGKLPSNPVSFPTIDLLGIYPNAQALTLQALILVLTAAVIGYEYFNQRKQVASQETG